MAEKGGNRVRVGGWLTFFCVLLVIILPLAAFGNFTDFTDATQNGGLDPNTPIGSAVSHNATGGLLIAIWSFFAGLLIWRGSPSGKRIAVVFLVAYPLLAALFNAMSLLEIGGLGGQVVGSVRADLILDIVGKALFSAVWLCYFKLSKRVKRTYELRA